jgi:Secretion system C-terminal sorting domain
MMVSTQNILSQTSHYQKLMRDKIQLLLLFVLFFLGAHGLYASHLTGSTITYECLGGNMYRVHLHEFADCQGIPPGTPTAFVVAGATLGCNFPTTTTGWTLVSSNEVTYFSPQYPTVCGIGPYDGVRDYHFTRDYDFTGVNCTKYKLSWTECCRNGSSNNISNAFSTGLTVVTDTINLALGCNSSPVWHNAPPRLATAQYINNFDLGATDVDGDSLVYSFVSALDGNGNPVAYNLGFGFTNPLGNNWVESLDSETGLLTLDPNGAPVRATIAIRVDEYRNGAKIGSVRQDFEILGLQGLPGSNTLPTISGPVAVSGCVNYGDTIIVPPGGSMCFDFSAADADPGNGTQLSWMSDLPGGVLTNTSGIGPDTVLGISPTARICWTAPMTFGYHFVTVTAIDTALQLNNMVTQRYCIRYGDTSLVWPGDADNNLVADAFDLLPIGLSWGSLFNFDRPAGPSNAWVGYSSMPWQQYSMGLIDKKFSDCNGDSLIDDDDTLAITLNYGLTHTKAYNPVARGTMVDPPFRLILPDSASVGDTIWAPIILGDNVVGASNIYGYAFRLNYDATLIDSSTFWIDYSNSWLGNATNSLDIARNHSPLYMCDGAQVRKTQTTVSGMGEVARAHFVIIDNIDGKRAAIDSASLHMFFSDVRVIGLDGSALPIDVQPDSMMIYDQTVDLSRPVVPTSVQLFPNPAQDQLTIKGIGMNVEAVQVLNLQGQLLLQRDGIGRDRLRLDVSELAKGMYFVRVQAGGISSVHQVVLQ